MFSELTFQHPFRKYQRMILHQLEAAPGDERYHLVSPPGSGKTIVGLELIRRFGQPAVVFAPTTTIQRQWQEKVGMFTQDPDLIPQLTSLDPRRLAPINIYTYQLISTPGQSLERVNQMALGGWLEDLVIEGQANDEASAQPRLETLRQNNPVAYRRELSKRYLGVKRTLLRSQAAEIGPFLHLNARRLIKALIDYGVRTVVLDECHHLLDYWAIVLRYLIGQIDGPRVIGLTATLPNPENETQFENYTSLLGEVDFEVPTPAVVKEGDLAPYRDLVHFVEPSEREMAYLLDIQSAFEAAIEEVTTHPRFEAWIRQMVLRPTDQDAAPLTWEAFLRTRPLFSLAVLRFLNRAGHDILGNRVLPQEALEELSLEDWGVLLERYGLDVLKLSPDPADHEQLKLLRKRLLPFGMTLTERGLRQSRSPGDLVLAFSESKDRAVAEILSAEAQAMGEGLRAVVVTDFERKSSGVRGLRDVLDADAGSALRAFAYLVQHPQAGKLDPILVTGKTLLVDADHGDPLLQLLNKELEFRKIRARCAFRKTRAPYALEVVGEGSGWTSSVYVSLVTRAFEEGLTKCLVGTRGIFGEGWDSLKLNTLIDLTSVTTSTSVQQLRGRSIRLDPSWPRKVAHNWDVICVVKSFKKGDGDLRRFELRHRKYWGVVPVSRAQQILHDTAEAIGAALDFAPGEGDAAEAPLHLSPELAGQVVKGVSHVSPELAYQLAVHGFRRVYFDRITRHMLSQVRRRVAAYDLWRIGEEYSNFSYTTTRLDARDLKIRTVYTVEDTVKRMLRSFRASMLAGVLLTGWLGLRVAFSVLSGAEGFDPFCFSVAIFMLGGILLSFFANLPRARKLGWSLLVEQPTEAILLDVGRALLRALKEAGLISRNLQPEYVRAIEQPDQSCQILLDYASPEDASVFINAYHEIFEPVRDPRYLILRTDGRLPNLGLSAVWLAVRGFFRNRAGHPSAYHPVPRVLGARKERAEAFARHWKRYVGGGRLVYARSEEGRQILLKARAQRRPNVKGLAFEVWR